MTNTETVSVADRDADVAFERLLAELSARFINLSADEVDREIETAQRRICEALDIDRSVFWQVSDSRPGAFVLTHLYQRGNVPPVIREIDRQRTTSSNWVLESSAPVPVVMGVDAQVFFPGLLERLRSGQTLVIPRLAALPSEAKREADLMRQFGATANLTFPLSAGGEFLGALGLDLLGRERDWPASLVERLQIVAGVFANALARKRADEALRASEERLRLAATAAGTGLWEVDVDSGKIWATPEAKELYGFQPDANPDLAQVLERVHPEDRNAVRTRLQGAIHEGDSYSAEYRLLLPGIGVRWINARGRPVALRAGEPKRLMGVSVDVTDRNAREEELHQALEEVQRLRDQLQQENVYLRQEASTRHGPARIIGRSTAIQRVVELAAQVAPTVSTVLLTGETGTGKERFASFIHHLSPRRDRAMVRVNCSAIPATLIESELFGREKGAYTGALSKQIGRFELAHGSTLFLDEIGDLPIEMQVKLLRVLQERQFERLGSPQPIPVDVRIIAASNRDLEQLVRDGDFRQDLYYRLAVFPITLPPMRERIDDLPMLVEAFVEELAAAMGKHIEAVSRKSLDALAHYHWPGNVRELRNTIERALILSPGPVLQIDAPKGTARTPETVPALPSNLGIHDVERDRLLKVLHDTGWRIRGPHGAAQVLGLKPTTLETRMAKLGIRRP